MPDRRSGPLPPIPLSIVTGFLGAGKTTLLNRLLGDEALADTVVIINEFGEIGLDHLFVKAVDDGLVLMSSGCLCCSIRGDLVATLEDLLRRRDNGRIAPFRRVVIETTGLADPAPVLHTVLYHPYLVMRYALAGVVTVVDAVNGAATLNSHREALRQVAVADRIVLSKTDLADDPRPLRAQLRALNPAAPVSSIGDADATLITALGLYDIDARAPDVRAWLMAEAFDDLAHDGEHDGEAHDVNRHREEIRAFCLTCDAPVARRAFDQFIELLRAAHGRRLLRVKGIVAIAEDLSRPVVIHGVQHVFHPPIMLPAWPDHDHRSRIVFVVDGLEREFVARLWDAFLGRPKIDTPDAEALSRNPLAPAGGGLLA